MERVLFPVFKESGRRYAEPFGQAVDHREGRISFAAFDSPDVRTMDTRPVGQVLLREAERIPNPTDDAAKRHARLILGRHLDGCYRLLLDSLQPRSIIPA
jgi:hypothetical protein